MESCPTPLSLRLQNSRLADERLDRTLAIFYEDVVKHVDPVARKELEDPRLFFAEFGAWLCWQTAGTNGDEGVTSTFLDAGEAPPQDFKLSPTSPRYSADTYADSLRQTPSRSSDDGLLAGLVSNTSNPRLLTASGVRHTTNQTHWSGVISPNPASSPPWWDATGTPRPRGASPMAPNNSSMTGLPPGVVVPASESAVGNASHTSVDFMEWSVTQTPSSRRRARVPPLALGSSANNATSVVSALSGTGGPVPAASPRDMPPPVELPLGSARDQQRSDRRFQSLSPQQGLARVFSEMSLFEDRSLHVDPNAIAPSQAPVNASLEQPRAPSSFRLGGAPGVLSTPVGVGAGGVAGPGDATGVGWFDDSLRRDVTEAIPPLPPAQLVAPPRGPDAVLDPASTPSTSLNVPTEPTTAAEQALIDILVDNNSAGVNNTSLVVFRAPPMTQAQPGMGLHSHASVPSTTPPACFPHPPSFPAPQHAALPIPTSPSTAGTRGTNCRDDPDTATVLASLSPYLSSRYSDVEVRSALPASVNPKAIVRMRALDRVTGDTVTIFRRGLCRLASAPSALAESAALAEAYGYIAAATVAVTQNDATQRRMEYDGMFRPLDAFVDGSATGNGYLYTVYEGFPRHWVPVGNDGMLAPVTASAEAQTAPVLLTLAEFYTFVWSQGLDTIPTASVAALLRWTMLWIAQAVHTLHQHRLVHGAITTDTYVIGNSHAAFRHVRDALRGVSIAAGESSATEPAMLLGTSLGDPVPSQVSDPADSILHDDSTEEDLVHDALLALTVKLGPPAMACVGPTAASDAPCDRPKDGTADLHDIARVVLDAFASAVGQQGATTLPAQLALLHSVIGRTGDPVESLLFGLVTAPTEHSATSVLAAVERSTTNATTDTPSITTHPSAGEQVTFLRASGPLLGLDDMGVIRYANAACGSLFGAALVAPERLPLHGESVLCTGIPVGQQWLPSFCSIFANAGTTNGQMSSPSSIPHSTPNRNPRRGAAKVSLMPTPPPASWNAPDRGAPFLITEILTANGDRIRVEVEVCLLDDCGAHSVFQAVECDVRCLVSLRDVSLERSIVAHNALVREERLIADTIPLPRVTVNSTASGTVAASPSAARLFRCTPSQLKALPLHRLFPGNAVPYHLAQADGPAAGRVLPALCTTADRRTRFSVLTSRLGSDVFLWPFTVAKQPPNLAHASDAVRNDLKHVQGALEHIGSPAPANTTCVALVCNGFGTVEFGTTADVRGSMRSSMGSSMLALGSSSSPSLGSSTSVRATGPGASILNLLTPDSAAAVRRAMELWKQYGDTPPSLLQLPGGPGAQHPPFAPHAVLGYIRGDTSSSPGRSANLPAPAASQIQPSVGSPTDQRLAASFDTQAPGSMAWSGDGPTTPTRETSTSGSPSFAGSSAIPCVVVVEPLHQEAWTQFLVRIVSSRG